MLSSELKNAEDEIEAEIIDALDKIRSENVNIRFSDDIILPKILKKMEHQYRTFLEFFDERISRKNIDKTKKQSKEHKISYVDIFKLLGLLYPNEDIIKAYQNIDSGTNDSIAYAIELLDNILPIELKTGLFPLVDNISIEERIHLCREVLPYFSSQKKYE